MLARLNDPANLITMAGLFVCVGALGQAVAGRPDSAIALGLWALMADHLDGLVAARTRNRGAETAEIGRNLDSLADLVSAGALPAVIALAAGGGSVLSSAAACCILGASALRLSYFNVFGKSGNRFVGMPTSYALPAISFFYLVAPYTVSFQHIHIFYCYLLFFISFMMISPFRIPGANGIGYYIIFTYIIVVSAFLLLRVF